MNNCEKWLGEFLKSGKLFPVESVRTTAKLMGFTSAQLKAAREILEVKTFHEFEGKVDTGKHYWYLPDKNETT